MPIQPAGSIGSQCESGIVWAGGVTSSLLTDLVHYWTLNEASGTRADVVGGATLTDNNTVGSTTGKNGNAALFAAASSEYLSAASFSLPSSPTVSFWFYGTDTSSLAGTFALGAFGNSTFSVMKKSVAAALLLRISNGSSNVEATSAAGKWDGLWHHVVAYQGADGKAHLWVDGTESTSAAALTGTLYVGPGTLRVGLQLDYLSGAMDEVGVWSRILTSTEIATLYNSGTGKFYPSF